MIANNQLNEQDFDFGGKAALVSSEDESESQNSNSEQSSVHELDVEQSAKRLSLKMWYHSFADNQKSGFKHNSFAFNNEVAK